MTDACPPISAYRTGGVSTNSDRITEGRTLGIAPTTCSSSSVSVSGVAAAAWSVSQAGIARTRLPHGDADVFPDAPVHARRARDEVNLRDSMPGFSGQYVDDHMARLRARNANLDLAIESRGTAQRGVAGGSSCQ